MFGINEVEQRVSVTVSRPDVFFGMNHFEMSDLRRWLEGIEASGNTTPPEDQANMYADGVRFGLAQIGQGFSVLPGASPLTHPWTDALGTAWRWDREYLQPVADKSMNHSDTEDFTDMSDADFVCFVRGLLNATLACGWIVDAQTALKQAV
ncbi:MAG: hypothetical protein ACYCQL_00725 [Acidithiobacillus sp.]